MVVDVKAIVVTGRGIATDWRESETAALSNELGIVLVSGSLNLVADKPLWLDSKLAIMSTEQGHLYWRASLNGWPVIVNRWKRDCPAHVFEIYADTRLREKFNLKDGDQVCLSLDKSIVDIDKSGSFTYLASWYLTWFCREKAYYTNDKYLNWTRRKPISKFTWRAAQT